MCFKANERTILWTQEGKGIGKSCQSGAISVNMDNEGMGRDVVKEEGEEGRRRDF